MNVYEAAEIVYGTKPVSVTQYDAARAVVVAAHQDGYTFSRSGNVTQPDVWQYEDDADRDERRYAEPMI